MFYCYVSNSFPINALLDDLKTRTANIVDGQNILISSSIIIVKKLIKILS